VRRKTPIGLGRDDCDEQCRGPEDQHGVAERVCASSPDAIWSDCHPQIIHYVRRVFVVEYPNFVGDDFVRG